MKRASAALLLTLGTGCLMGQQAATSTASTAAAPTIRATTQEVLLDLIVRDKHGRPVKDLKAGDIQITDDGQPEEIKSIRLVESNQASGGGVARTGAGANSLDPLRQIRLITLVYDSLDQNGRRFSKDASYDLLKTDLGTNVYFGIFTVDHQLRVLQQYTADRDLIRKAIERATSGAYTQFAGDSAAIQHNLESTLGVASGDSVGLQNALSASPSARTDPSAFVNLSFAQLTLQMLQSTEKMASDVQGRASIFSLMDIAKEQTSLPGRKTLMYFSQGLNVPQNLVEQVRTIIGLANRANVSIYAVDASQLNSGSQNRNSSDMLSGALNASRQQQENPDAAIRPDQVKALDTANDSLRANGQNNLSELAEATGGLLIANTNDPKQWMKRVSEDINAYYEVSYSPQIDKFDGHFRKISVKLARNDIKVQTRTGYFALPFSAGGESVLPFEMPMLAAMSATPMPQAFGYHASAMHFRPMGGNVQSDLVVDVPLKDITFVKDEAAKLYHTHFSAMMILKNEKGEVVEKFSKDVPYQGPLDKSDLFQKGDFILTHEVSVPPGHYTVETAVSDRTNQKVSAKKTAFNLTKPDNGVAISSVALIRRVDPLKTPPDKNDPLQFPGGKVTPSLSDSIPGGPKSSMSFYFVVYPEASIPDKPTVTMEFLLEGTSLGQGSPELPAAGPDGTIPYVATIPIESFKPGHYEIRVTAHQGATQAQERVAVAVE